MFPREVNHETSGTGVSLPILPNALIRQTLRILPADYSGLSRGKVGRYSPADYSPFGGRNLFPSRDFELS